jgi:hypothetical protein
MSTSRCYAFYEMETMRAGFLKGKANRQRTCGQAMIEYMILAVLLIVAGSILAIFLYAFRENGGRVLDMAASEYP